MSSVVHFEMPAKDKKRVSEFYSKVFGWDMQQFGPEMGNYIMATTTETEQTGGVPKNPGAINGGFFDYKDDELSRVPHVVIAVDNLEESISSIKEAGGEINGKPMDIPGVGRYISFKDTEENIVGMLQSFKM